MDNAVRVRVHDHEAVTAVDSTAGAARRTHLVPCQAQVVRMRPVAEARIHRQWACRCRGDLVPAASTR